MIEQFNTLWTQNPYGTGSLILFLLGILVFFIGSFIFRLRAVTNKKAWDGYSKPLLIIGMFLIAVGIIGVLVFSLL